MSLMASEDLKYEILQLKKKLHAISSENCLLKVNIRKLHNEIDKKNKQIDSLLDPKKSTCIRKIISERGATMIINLKQRNSELEETLITKDNTIKKLQSEIQTSKTYSTREILSANIKRNENKHVSLKSYKECNHVQPQICNKYRSRSLSATPVLKQSCSKSSSDIQMKYVRLAQNLQKINSANNASNKNLPLNINKTNKTKSDTKENNYSPISNENHDIEKYLINLFDEIEKMKGTVLHLSNEQESTKKMLRDKKRNMDLLSRQVKCLQKTKTAQCSVFTPNHKMRTEQRQRRSCYSDDSFERESSEERHENSPESEKSAREFIDLRKNSILQEDIPENVEQYNDNEDVKTGDAN